MLRIIFFSMYKLNVDIILYYKNNKERLSCNSRNLRLESTDTYPSLKRVFIEEHIENLHSNQQYVN